MPDAFMPATAPMRLYVCTTCRDAAHDPAMPSAGTRLHAALLAGAPGPAIELVGVECLSGCKRPCTVSFTAPGKWTYVFGDLSADTSAATVLHGARLYAEAPDGIIAWKLRPDVLKKGVLARVPAMPWSIAAE